MAALPTVEAALDHLVRSRIAVAVVTCARDPSRVVLANDAFTALTGLRADDAVAHAISARALLHGASGSFTEIVDGVVVSVAPLRDGSDEPAHCIVLVRPLRADREAFECESA